MKLLHKAIAAVGFTALAIAAAYPHVDAYLKSRPLQLSKDAAAKRYLSLVCPANKTNDYMQILKDNLKKERGVAYYNSDNLAAANARVGALEARLEIADKAYWQQLEKQTSELKNPKFIWPANVQQDINSMVISDFDLIGRNNSGELLLKNLSKEEIAKLDEQGNERAKVASQIRHNLGLPPRGKGC